MHSKKLAEMLILRAKLQCFLLRVRLEWTACQPEAFSLGAVPHHLCHIPTTGFSPQPEEFHPYQLVALLL